MKKLRVGIIGLGVGEQHIAGCEGGSAGEAVVLCDFSPEKLREVSARHPGIATTERAEDVLDDPDIDVVSIASWDNHHYRQVMRAIEKGKHLFVEKPLCLQPGEARDIRRALAAKPGLKMSSNLILRRSKRFLKVKAMIAAGRFGDLYHLEADYNYGRLEKIVDGWRGQIEGYSVVLGGGVHTLDLLMWFCGSDVTEVTAYGNRLSTGGAKARFDDCVVSILKFRNGATGKMAANFGCVHPHFHQVALYGTRATFLNTLDGGRLITDRNPAASVEPVSDAYPGCQKGELLRDFLDSLAAGREPEVPTGDVFKTISVCFAIEESARTGAPVTVEYI
ncbi:MAG: Gfo/Idh/MocA family oxidoreductase [Fibrobacteria bacterium]